MTDEVLIVDEFGVIPPEVWKSLERDIADARVRMAIEAGLIADRVDPIGRIITRVMTDGISTKDGCA